MPNGQYIDHTFDFFKFKSKNKKKLLIICENQELTLEIFKRKD